MAKSYYAPVDFDIPIERRGTDSLKWRKYLGRDIIPLWVADMDFLSPPSVIAALHERVAQGVFGYALPPDELVETVIERLFRKYRWQVDPDWIIWLPGLVTGLNVTCRAVGKDRDDVMTAIPVYPPFLTAPSPSRRNLVTVPLKKEETGWTFDFDAMAEAVTPRTGLFILCNPHNPVGRIYRRDELLALADFCEKHDIIICSDEIHCDLLLDTGKSHIPTASLDPDIARRTITLMAPSKTYNLPGLGCSFAVISEKDLRKRFRRAMGGIVPDVNVLGYTAALAAYKDDGRWLEGLIEYLRGNRDMVKEAVDGIDGLSMPHVEATYLAWIETRGTGIENPGKFFEEAGIGLWNGRDFGVSDAARLNFACHRSLLGEALDRMARAMELPFS